MLVLISRASRSGMKVGFSLGVLPASTFDHQSLQSLIMQEATLATFPGSDRAVICNFKSQPTPQTRETSPKHSPEVLDQKAQKSSTQSEGGGSFRSVIAASSDAVFTLVTKGLEVRTFLDSGSVGLPQNPKALI